ncbi:MAG: hypothetical protein ACI956_001453, partial [Nonlabens sp.]
LITWGKYTYTDNLQGLGVLMTDLEKADEELYKQLLPEYSEMVERQRQGKLIAALGGSVGLGFMLHGLLSALVGRDDGEKWRLNYATLTIGGVVTTGSLIYANTTLVKRFDIIHFANRFNELAKGTKLRFSLSPQLHLDDTNTLGGGLSLRVRF